jgi:hypothetical protein
MPNSLGSIPFDRSIVRKKSTKYRFEIDPAAYQLFMDGIYSGSSVADSAWAAGLKPDTVYHWIKKGEILFESDAEFPPHSAAWQYARFFHDYKKASSQAVVKHSINIDRASVKSTPTNWTASAWKLERLRPEQFSQKYLIEKITDQKLLEYVKFTFDHAPDEDFREKLAAIISMIPTLRLKDAA